jgi:GGDEF domain-containing protein
MAGQTTPTTSARSHAEEGGDRLGFYRLLASFPSLSSYRAKFYAVVAAGAFLPAFLLVLVLVLGAGRVGPLVLIVLVVLLAGIATFAVCRCIDRLLVPLDLAEEAVDDVAFDRGVKRTELPGSDTAAQVLRGVQGLAKRVERDLRDARVKGERDELTGLYRRSVGRERAQQLIDRETRKGRRVRVVVADVIGFRAFNEAQGSGHGDAMLKAIAARLKRVAGDEGLAIRWGGDAFMLVQTGGADELPEPEELLGRPIVVKGSEEPLRLALGSTQTETRVAFDTLALQAEASLAIARARA